MYVTDALNKYILVNLRYTLYQNAYFFLLTFLPKLHIKMHIKPHENSVELPAGQFHIYVYINAPIGQI